MRKYFLISAVALLATSTANATTDYAEVTAKATIEVAGSLNCDDMDFGTIVVKQNNKAATIRLHLTNDFDPRVSYDSDDILSVADINPANCDNIVDRNLPTAIPLTNGSGAKMLVTDFDIMDDAVICGTLNIPANVKAGEYTGSFTATTTY
ncbi:MAG: hypothetical protein E7016_00930 [Alphaproteobacteria bacterium]|nr:hypothetical protein [Alphaproteobacteria bacterium]